jgi:hypothetical protein
MSLTLTSNSEREEQVVKESCSTFNDLQTFPPP